MHVKARTTRLPNVLGRRSSGACEVATISRQVPYVLRGVVSPMCDRLTVSARTCLQPSGCPHLSLQNLVGVCYYRASSFAKPSANFLEPSRQIRSPAPNLDGTLAGPAPTSITPSRTLLTGRRSAG